MNRRGFLRRAALVSALLGAGRLPLLARTGDRLPASVEPLTGFLAGYAGPSGARLGDSYRLTYDIVLWQGRDPATGATQNGLVGATEVRRIAVADGSRWGIDEVRRYAGTAHRLETRLRCARGPLDPVVSWETRATWHSLQSDQTLAGAPAPLVEGGQKTGIRVLHDDGRCEDSPRTLTSLWGLVHAVTRGANRTEDTVLDLLVDATSVSPGAQLQYDGLTEVEGAEGRAMRLASYLLTGHGILPTHVLVGEDGLPQLVTVSMVSYALRAAEALRR